MLFEQELARSNCRSMIPSLSRFMGMMERDIGSVYDLLPLTPDDPDSKGSYHLVRQCNMLHLSKDGAVAVGGKEDDAYPIPRTPGEQAECEQEHLE